MSASTVGRPRPSRRRTPTRAPSTAAHATSRAAGWRINASPTVRSRSRNTGHVTEPVVHPPDRVESVDAGGRRYLAPLRMARELVDGRDLVEAGCRESLAVGSIVAAFPGRA